MSVTATRAAPKPTASPRRRWWVGALIALVLIGLALPAADVWRRDRAAVDAALATVAGIEALPTPAGIQDVDDALTALERLRAVLAASRPLPPLLFDADAMDAAATRAWRRILLGRLRPLLVQRLEAPLRDPETPNGDRFEILESCLVLAGAVPVAITAGHALADRPVVLARLDAALSETPTDPPERQRSLAGHAGALLDLLATDRVAPAPGLLDDSLIAATRTAVTTAGLAAHGFALLRELPEAQALPVWRPADHAGPAAALLRRQSGRTLSEAIDGLFTAEGFTRVAVPGSLAVGTRLAAAGWVLGLPTTPEAVAGRGRELAGAILDIDGAEDIRSWDDLLGDLAIAVPAADTARTLAALAAPDSPLRGLLTAVAAETALPAPEGAAVARHFEPLRRAVVGAADQPGSLAAALAAGETASKALTRLGADPTGHDALAAVTTSVTGLQATARDLPDPPARLFTGLAGAAAAAALDIRHHGQSGK